MGKPKLLLRWGERTILGHLVETWENIGAAQLAVVTSAGPGPVADELAKTHGGSVSRIENPNAAEGMFSSVQAAARWNGWRESLTHFALSLGDQPQISRETLGSLLGFAAENAEEICQPSVNGSGKHPIIFPKQKFFELRNFRGPTLKDFLRDAAIRKWESSDLSLDLDLDTPEQYSQALQTFCPGSICPKLPAEKF